VKGKEKGEWTEKILHSFNSGKDGSSPVAGVALDAVGNVYGTTISYGKYGYGTLFELVAPVGTGSYQEKILWNFDGTDGYQPCGSLIWDSSGNLYGSTSAGGFAGGPDGYGCGFEGEGFGAGNVFELNLSPASTTTALSSSPNPSAYGQAVTFTAVVAPAPPDGETVSFVKGKTVLGTGALSDGSATFTTSTLKLGTTSVAAVYGGDSNFAGSKSNRVKEVVEKAGAY
jgi:hypothetical protein